MKVQRASVMCVGEVLTDPDILVFKSFCNPEQETMQSVTWDTAVVVWATSPAQRRPRLSVQAGFPEKGND